MWCRVKCENTKYWPDQRPQTYTAVGKNSSRQNIKNLIHINCLAADCRVESREELIELISFIFLSSLDSPGLEQLWFPSTGPTCPVLSFTTSWVSAPSPGLPLLSSLSSHTSISISALFIVPSQDHSFVQRLWNSALAYKTCKHQQSHSDLLKYWKGNWQVVESNVCTPSSCKVMNQC